MKKILPILLLPILLGSCFNSEENETNSWASLSTNEVNIIDTSTWTESNLTPEEEDIIIEEVTGEMDDIIRELTEGITTSTWDYIENNEMTEEWSSSATGTKEDIIIEAKWDEDLKIESTIISPEDSAN